MKDSHCTVLQLCEQLDIVGFLSYDKKKMFKKSQWPLTSVLQISSSFSLTEYICQILRNSFKDSQLYYVLQNRMNMNYYHWPLITKT